MIRQIPVEEKATILASLAYIIALAFYKHWLHSQYDVMNGSLIERAFATAGKPWYWFFLLTGFAFIILLVCMGVHLFRKDMDKPGNLVGVILNIVLIVILVTVFWDPIFTTFVVLAFVAGTSAAAGSMAAGPAARATPNAIATNRFRPSVPAPMRMMFLISCPSPMGAAACRARPPLPNRRGVIDVVAWMGAASRSGRRPREKGPSTRRRASDGPQWVRRRGAA